MNNLYDDPYVMCVCRLISQHNPAEIQRMLVDNNYIKNIILKETRITDFAGPFLDAIVEEIYTHKKRMEMMRELDKLSVYFYNNLDVERFRKTIRYVVEKYGFFELEA